MKIRTIIELLDKKVYEYGDNYPIDLTNGIMGHCIYFYHISRISDNMEYHKRAELLMNELFKQITKVKMFDIKCGLAGIGLGIDYLIESGYVEGDINDILGGVDDILFKKICNPEKSDSNDILLQLHLIYYFSVRLKKQNKNSENEFLFRESIINAINFISEKIYSFFLEESRSFNFDDSSILSLLVLNQCGELYKEKVYRILKDISFYVLSKIPVLHSNRLHLLYSMDRVNKKIETKGWNEHMKLLARESDIECIIENELADDIYFSNGLSAIYFLLSCLRNYFSSDQIYKYKGLIVNKIENSLLWGRLIDDEEFLKLNDGLFSGYKGVSLLLHKHYDDENRFN